MVSPPDPLYWLDDSLKNLESEQLLRRRRERASPQQAIIELDGRELINFGSNDYLGLAADPRVSGAAVEAVQEAGWGSGASPLVNGRSRWHARLEDRLAEFEGAEAGLVFASGFSANLSTLPALVGKGDVIFSDQLNHASIVDGCRLARAEVRAFPHGNVDALDKLVRSAGNYRRRVIVTNSLFSMDGDFAPLVGLVELAERHDGILMVDEAHATGVLGNNGRGVAEALGVDRRVHVRMGTLSKALGGIGGFICGQKCLIEWLTNRARTYMYSTAQPAATCAAALAALDIVQDEPFRRQTLLERAAKLRQDLQEKGWNVGGAAAHIIPIVIGSADRTMQMSTRLDEQGLYVPAIRPPSVPEGQSRLRIGLSYLHTPEMIEKLLAALGDPDS